jgi:hypothetical protein
MLKKKTVRFAAVLELQCFKFWSRYLCMLVWWSLQKDTRWSLYCIRLCLTSHITADSKAITTVKRDGVIY